MPVDHLDPEQHQKWLQEKFTVTLSRETIFRIFEMVEDEGTDAESLDNTARKAGDEIAAQINWYYDVDQNTYVRPVASEDELDYVLEEERGKLPG